MDRADNSYRTDDEPDAGGAEPADSVDITGEELSGESLLVINEGDNPAVFSEESQPGDEKSNLESSETAGDDASESGVMSESGEGNTNVAGGMSQDIEEEAPGGTSTENGVSENNPEVLDSEDEGFEMPLVQVVEAILFAADEAVSIEKIAKAAGTRIRREAVAEAIKELQTEYRESERAFEIVEIAEKFQLLTRPEFARNVQALYGKRAIKEQKDKKLSPAALDTLAIIAYKQPVTRAEVEAVRGVGCGQVMRQLMERGSIKPVGKKMDVIGYPLLYGTTEFFLQEFGLASLDVLPMAAELRRLTKIELPVPEVVPEVVEASPESDLPENHGVDDATSDGEPAGEAFENSSASDVSAAEGDTHVSEEREDI